MAEGMPCRKVERDMHEVNEQVIHELEELVCRVWATPEPGFMEYESSRAHVEYLRAQGFEVRENVADTVTGYMAVWGKGKPVIALLGEFDALHGLSQEAFCTHEKKAEGMEMGQGCGHHLLGVGAIAAGLMLREIMEKEGLEGQIRIYGCPAEESGSGKAYMARDGFFDDCDVAITWHPSLYNKVSSGSSQSCIQSYFRFHGVASHAAGAPHLGRSALDAAELMSVGVNYLREHMEDSDRVHYAYTDAGGTSPNVVQAHSEVRYFIRSATNPQCQKLYERVKKIAQGAALMTETELEILFDEGLSNTVPNFTLEHVMDGVFRRVGVPEYTEEERAMAQAFKDSYPREQLAGHLPENVVDKVRLKESILTQPMCDYYVECTPYDICEMGSTDVGDVSWVIPTVTANVNCYSYGAGGHSWQWVAQGKTSYAMKGMIQAGRIMAETARELILHPELLEEAWKEQRRRLEGESYQCLIPPEVKPHSFEK